MRAGLIQLCCSDDPAANLPITEALVREAAAGGAELIRDGQGEAGRAHGLADLGEAGVDAQVRRRGRAEQQGRRHEGSLHGRILPRPQL